MYVGFAPFPDIYRTIVRTKIETQGSDGVTMGTTDHWYPMVTTATGLEEIIRVTIIIKTMVTAVTVDKDRHLAQTKIITSQTLTLLTGNKHIFHSFSLLQT